MQRPKVCVSMLRQWHHDLHCVDDGRLLGHLHMHSPHTLRRQLAETWCIRIVLLHFMKDLLSI